MMSAWSLQRGAEKMKKRRDLDELKKEVALVSFLTFINSISI